VIDPTKENPKERLA
jgi:hypothetical protein